MIGKALILLSLAVMLIAVGLIIGVYTGKRLQRHRDLSDNLHLIGLHLVQAESNSELAQTNSEALVAGHLRELESASRLEKALGRGSFSLTDEECQRFAKAIVAHLSTSDRRITPNWMGDSERIAQILKRTRKGVGN